MNLTRDEARARADVVSVASYAIDLDLTADGDTFPSTTTVRFSARQSGTATFIDLIARRAHEIVLNGEALDPADVFDGTRIRLDRVEVENELRVVADCSYMHTGEGLHRFVDPVDGRVYLHSQFEVADARRTYACFEQPDLKATFTFTVTVPEDWKVVSNSPVNTVEPGSDGTRVHRFVTSPRMSTYITALVAGPYTEVRDTSGDVDLGLFCRQSLAEHLDAEALFEVTRQGFDYFERLFDYPYPFGPKYDQLFVPEFNAGAMENAGCITILEDYLFRSKVTDAAYERRAETVLHEMAHMWFGDLVTMRWWDDLWLNESFATYASVLAQAEVTRWTDAWTTFANAEKTWAYRQDQLPSTHPIAADIKDIEDVEVNFDGITYAKGAAVLKLLVAWVGQEQFVAGLRRYFRRHEWGNTSLRDLLSVLEETSGRDLKAWSQEWLETAGINTLRPEFEVDDRGRFTSFVIRQEAPQEWPTLRSHRLAIGLYDRSGDGLMRRRRVELDVVGPRTEVPELLGEPQPDLVLLNDDDLTYCKIRLDDQSFATLTAAIGEFRDSLPRALCWTAAWDMCRDAEIPARDYVRLVVEGVGAEGDIGVVQSLLRQAKAALDVYVDPDYRAEGLGLLAERLSSLMRKAEPGSDRQLAFVRAFAVVATSEEELATVRGVLNGDAVLEGLAVDTELRWHLLRQLVAGGAARNEEIEAELERDNTAAGQRHAAAARAARPTVEAKEEAWASVVERDELPVAVQSAVISGFVQPGQRDLLARFTDRYFSSIVDLWATRTNETAQNIVVGLYPGLLVDQETVERTDAFLAEADPMPALRRLVLEGRDGVVRALRAQAKDREAAEGPAGHG